MFLVKYVNDSLKYPFSLNRNSSLWSEGLGFGSPDSKIQKNKYTADDVEFTWIF